MDRKILKKLEFYKNAIDGVPGNTTNTNLRQAACVHVADTRDQAISSNFFRT